MSESIAARNREGSATAFRDVESVQRLIDALGDEWARLAATLAYWGCGRINAVLHLKAEDLRGGHINYAPRNAKVKGKAHRVRQSGSLKAALKKFNLPKNGYLFPAESRSGRATYQQRWFHVAKVEDAEREGWRLGSQRRHSRERGELVRMSRTLDTQWREVRATETFNACLKEAADKLIAEGWDQYHGVSSHTFRRSMCSYLHFTKGWSLREVMVVSGHKSLGTLSAYLEPDREAVAARIDEI